MAQQPAETGVPARGIYVTPRRILIGIAIVLGIVLIVLLVYLLLMMQPREASVTTRVPIAGLEAELVVLGPDTGEKPRFERPMGVAWAPDGRSFYVADTANNRICAFRSDGTFIREFGGFGIAKPLEGAQETWQQGELNYPTDVATDDEGRVYVADFYNDSVSVFDADGSFLRRFPDPKLPVGKGSSGQEGGGIAVTAVAVEDNRVYATDAYQVVVFTLNGEFVAQFGRPGTGPEALDRPNGIAVDDGGRVVVSDSNNNRVTAFTREGELVWSTGNPLPAGSYPVENVPFVLPRGLTTMDEDGLLIADPLAQALVEMTLSGEVVGDYGQRGARPAEVNFPNDVDWHDGRILVADRENDRVQVVRIVRE